MIREKNLQLTELYLYINNIARCLDIVNIYVQGEKINSETLSTNFTPYK